MWIDTHCHIQAEEFDHDREQVIERARLAKVNTIILSVENLQDSRRAWELACQTPGVYCLAGVHPQQADQWNDQSADDLRSLIAEDLRISSETGQEPKIVGIGEIGLDYYYENSPRAVQQTIYREQLKIACELDLPIVIHERDAFLDSYNILLEARKNGYLRQTEPGVAHCFSGSLESARLLLKLGLYLGFDGPLTFKNARCAPQIVSEMPLSRLLLETDSPYLSPVPLRGKRNEPANVVHIGNKVAELRQLTPEEVAAETTANACRLFGLSIEQSSR